MDQARTLIKEGHTSGLVVAYTQTHGYGRFKRSWISQEGNFLGTFFLPYNNIEGGLSLKVAQHIFKKLSPYCNGILRFKWPNDLMLGGKKLSGILLEKEDDFLLVGIGINLKHSPENIDQPTTCLFPDHAVTIDIAQFSDVIKDGFYESLGAPFSQAREFCLNHMQGINSPCTVKISENETLEGICRGLDQSGALLLELPSGEIKTLRTGDLGF
jgi:BirA family biotin operon repressor/biotin-[acetyl-CoA-carboxylase] ligase